MTAPTFDEATLRRLHEDLGAEADVTRDLVRTFLQSAEDLLREAREGLAKNDARVVQRVAHTLKSSAGTLGALRLSELARDLEASLAGGGRATREAVDALAEEYARARGPMEGWVP